MLINCNQEGLLYVNVNHRPFQETFREMPPLRQLVMQKTLTKLGKYSPVTRTAVIPLGATTSHSSTSHTSRQSSTF